MSSSAQMLAELPQQFIARSLNLSVTRHQETFGIDPAYCSNCEQRWPRPGVNACLEHNKCVTTTKQKLVSSERDAVPIDLAILVGFSW